MKAMVLDEFEGELQLKEIDKPGIDKNEVLIKVRATGVCHTDLKIISGKVPTVSVPHVLGHEIAGEAVEIGEKVNDVEEGDRFIVAQDITCGNCYYCRKGQHNLCVDVERKGFELDGGHAEYLAVPRSNLFELPDNVKFEEGAILPDAVGTPYTALKKTTLKPFHNVAVVGVGGLGIHGVQVAAVHGAEVIGVDIEDERLEMAKKYGADEVINSRKSDLEEELRKIDEEGVDYIMDFVGITETLETDLKCLKDDGTLFTLGYEYGQDFTVIPEQLVYRGIGIQGSRATTKGDLEEIIKLVGRGDLKSVITKRYSLEEANQALKDLENGEILGRAVISFP